MEIEVEDWGLILYEEAWRRQTSCFEALVQAKREQLRGVLRRPPERDVEQDLAMRLQSVSVEQSSVEHGHDCPQSVGEQFAALTKQTIHEDVVNASPSDHRPVVTMPAGRIILCEHPPVYTLGRSGHEDNLLIDREKLRRMGATLYRIDRGGDITYHGPGQVVCYPILDLEALGLGLRMYIHCLEEAAIRTCADYGVVGERIEGATGVWVTDHGPECRLGQVSPIPRKICAIGVRASHNVTMHGLALNVSTDLSRFCCINPCGFTDRGVTSLCYETGRDIPVQEVKQQLAAHLQACLRSPRSSGL